MIGGDGAPGAAAAIGPPEPCRHEPHAPHRSSTTLSKPPDSTRALEPERPADAAAGSDGARPRASDQPAPEGDVALWARIVRSPGASPMLRAVLTNSSLVEIKDTVAVLECPSRFVPGARSRLPELAGVFERALGRRVEVRIVEAGIADPTDAGTREHPAPPAPESGSGASPASVASPHGAPPAPSGDPLVRLALELFNARIVSVQPHGGRPAAP